MSVLEKAKIGKTWKNSDRLIFTFKDGIKNMKRTGNLGFTDAQPDESLGGPRRC